MQCLNCGKKVYANEKCSCGQKAPKKSNGGVLINTIICMFLLMIIVFSLILTLSLRTVLNKNIISDAVDNVELADIEIDDKKLDEYIHEKYIDDTRISIENVDNLLEEDFIKDFINDKVQAYQDYFLDEGDMPYITSDDIIELIEDNSDTIYEEVGLRFLEKDKEELREQLAELDSFKDDSEFFFDSKFGSTITQTYFSYANVIFLIVMMAVIFIQWFIVYILNARRISRMVFKYGLAVTIPSFIILAASVTAKIAVSNVDSANKLLSPSIIPFMLFSAVLFAVGLLITILGSAVNRGYKKKVRAAASAISIDDTGVVPEYYNDQQSEPAPDRYNNSQYYGNVNTPDEQFYELAGSNGKPEENIGSSVNANEVPTPADNVSAGNVQTAGSVKNICPNCSFENKERAAFCCKCGTKLKKDVQK